MSLLTTALIVVALVVFGPLAVWTILGLLSWAWDSLAWKLEVRARARRAKAEERKGSE